MSSFTRVLGCRLVTNVTSSVRSAQKSSDSRFPNLRERKRRRAMPNLSVAPAAARVVAIAR